MTYLILCYLDTPCIIFASQFRVFSEFLGNFPYKSIKFFEGLLGDASKYLIVKFVWVGFKIFTGLEESHGRRRCHKRSSNMKFEGYTFVII